MNSNTNNVVFSALNDPESLILPGSTNRIEDYESDQEDTPLLRSSDKDSEQAKPSDAPAIKVRLPYPAYPVLGQPGGPTKEAEITQYMMDKKRYKAIKKIIIEQKMRFLPDPDLECPAHVALYNWCESHADGVVNYNKTGNQILTRQACLYTPRPAMLSETFDEQLRKKHECPVAFFGKYVIYVSTTASRMYDAHIRLYTVLYHYANDTRPLDEVELRDYIVAHLQPNPGFVRRHMDALKETLTPTIGVDPEVKETVNKLEKTIHKFEEEGVSVKIEQKSREAILSVSGVLSSLNETVRALFLTTKTPQEQMTFIVNRIEDVISFVLLLIALWKCRDFEIRSYMVGMFITSHHLTTTMINSLWSMLSWISMRTGEFFENDEVVKAQGHTDSTTTNGFIGAVKDVFVSMFTTMDPKEIKVATTKAHYFNGVSSAIRNMKQFGDWIFELFDHFFCLCYEKAVGVPYNTDGRDALIEEAVKLVKETAWMRQSDFVDKIKLDGVKQFQVENIYNKYYDLATKLMEAGFNAKNFTTFYKSMDYILSMYEEVLRCRRDAKSRERPVCVRLVGRPGVGKTILLEMIRAVVTSKENLKNDMSSVYYRRANDQYWSGYRNQPICIFEEIFQIDTQEARSMQAEEVIAAVNEAPYPLNMADIESKGCTFFTSKLVILTSNEINTPANVGLADPGAFKRRADFFVYVDVVDDVKDHNGQIKKDTPPSPNIYVLRMFDPITETYTNKIWNFQKFIGELFLLYDRRHANVAKFSEASDKLYEFCATPDGLAKFISEGKEYNQSSWMAPRPSEKSDNRGFRYPKPHRDQIYAQCRIEVDDNIERPNCTHKRIVNDDCIGDIIWYCSRDQNPIDVEDAPGLSILDYNYFIGIIRNHPNSYTHFDIMEGYRCPGPWNPDNERIEPSYVMWGDEPIPDRMCNNPGDDDCKCGARGLHHCSLLPSNHPWNVSIDSIQGHVSRYGRLHQHSPCDLHERGEEDDHVWTHCACAHMIAEIAHELRAIQEDQHYSQCDEFGVYPPFAVKPLSPSYLPDFTHSRMFPFDNPQVESDTIWAQMMKNSNITVTSSTTSTAPPRDLKQQDIYPDQTMDKEAILLRVSTNETLAQQLVKWFATFLSIWSVYKIVTIGLRAMSWVYHMYQDSKWQEVEREEFVGPKDAQNLYSGNEVSAKTKIFHKKNVEHKPANQMIQVQVDQATNQVAALVQENIGTIRIFTANNKFTQYCCMLQGRMGMCAAHLFYPYLEDPDCVEKIVFEFKKVQVVIDKSDLVNKMNLSISQDSDYAMFVIRDKTVPEFRDITQHFLWEKDIDGIVNTNLVRVWSDQRGSYCETVQSRNLAHNAEYYYDPTTSVVVNRVLCVVGNGFASGDCGSVYLHTNRFLNQKIVGIHVAGNSTVGYLTIVTQDMFNMKCQMRPMRGRVDPPLPLYPMAILPNELSVRVPEKSHIIPSAIHGVISQPITHPARLAVTKDYDPYQDIIEKWNVPDVKAWPPGMRDIVDYEKLHHNYFIEPQFQTIHQACLRPKNFVCQQPIDVNTSPGYPSNTPSVKLEKKHKGDFIDPETHVPTMKLMVKVNSLIVSLLGGVPIGKLVKFSEFSKDERRTFLNLLLKIMKGTRGITVSPVEFLVLYRMLFGDYIENQTRGHNQTSSAVGINVHSDEWTMLAHQLNIEGEDDPIVLDIDVKAWDSHVMSCDSEADSEVQLHWYELREKRCDMPTGLPDGMKQSLSYEERMFLRDAMLLVLRTPRVHIMKNVAYTVYHSMITGFPDTAGTNTRIQSRRLKSCCWYWFQLKFGKERTLFEMLCMIFVKAYGDDGLVHLVAAMRFMNLGHFAIYFKEFLNTEITDSQKRPIEIISVNGADVECNAPQTRLSQVQFLKRNFVKLGKEKTYRAPLVKHTLKEMVNWCRDSEPIKIATMKVCISAAIEWWHHGKKEWMTNISEVNLALLNAGCQQIPFTYDDITAKFRGGQIDPLGMISIGKKSEIIYAPDPVPLINQVDQFRPLQAAIVAQVHRVSRLPAPIARWDVLKHIDSLAFKDSRGVLQVYWCKSNKFKITIPQREIWKRVYRKCLFHFQCPGKLERDQDIAFMHRMWAIFFPELTWNGFVDYFTTEAQKQPNVIRLHSQEMGAQRLPNACNDIKHVMVAQASKESIDKTQKGLISGVTETLSEMTAIGSRLPIVGNEMRLASTIFKKVTNLAESVGLSHPQNLAPQGPQILQNPEMANARGLLNAPTLGLDPINRLVARSRMPQGIDYNLLDNYKQRPGIIKLGEFSAADVINSVIENILVRPGLAVKVSNIDPLKSYFVPTPGGQLMSLFRAWRGGFKFCIMFTCPKQITARIRVHFFPLFPFAFPTSITEAQVGDCYTHTIDICGDTEFCFTIPYVGTNNCSWVPTFDIMNESWTTNVNGQYDKYINGYLCLSIMNKPVAYDVTADTTIRYSIWMSFAEDFQFLLPRLPFKSDATHSWSIGAPVAPPEMKAQSRMESLSMQEKFATSFGPFCPSNMYVLPEGLTLGETVRSWTEIMHRLSTKWHADVSSVYSNIEYNPWNFLISGASHTLAPWVLFLYSFNAHCGQVRFNIQGENVGSDQGVVVTTRLLTHANSVEDTADDFEPWSGLNIHAPGTLSPCYDFVFPWFRMNNYFNTSFYTDEAGYDTQLRTTIYTAAQASDINLNYRISIATGEEYHVWNPNPVTRFYPNGGDLLEVKPQEKTPNAEVKSIFTVRRPSSLNNINKLTAQSNKEVISTNEEIREAVVVSKATEQQALSGFNDMELNQSFTPVKDMAPIYKGWKLFPDIGLKEILERQYPLSSTTITSNNAQGTQILTLNFPKMLTDISTLDAVLQNFTGLRAGVEVEFRVNTTQFHYGQLLITWMPNFFDTNGNTSLEPHLYQYNQMFNAATGNCVVMPFCAGNPIKIKIPYCFQKAYYNLVTDDTEVGKGSMFAHFQIYVLQPLRLVGTSSTVTVELTTYAKFTDVELYAPTINATTLDPLSKKKVRARGANPPNSSKD